MADGTYLGAVGHRDGSAGGRPTPRATAVAALGGSNATAVAPR